MFLKRDEELRELSGFLEAEGKTAAMIYGIRQIGKSSLLLQAVKDRSDVLYFECLDYACRIRCPMLRQSDGHLSGTCEETSNIYKHLREKTCRFGLSFPLYLWRSHCRLV